MSTMTMNLVSFYSNSSLLSGAIHYPKLEQNKQYPAIVLVHGFVGSKVGEHRLFVKAARYFSEKGFIVFRFDFRGCGESEGDYSDVTLTNQIHELQSTLDYIEEIPEVNKEQITVIGHSLGGAVASLTASIDNRVKQLLLWSPVANPFQDITRITGLLAVKKAAKEGVYDYQGFYISEQFFQDLKRHEPLLSVASYKQPVLIAHAEMDEDVPKGNAQLYFDSLKNRQTKTDVFYIAKADHTFSSYSFEHQLFEKSSNWLEEVLQKNEVQLLKQPF